jgi:hypothetical protein
MGMQRSIALRDKSFRGGAIMMSIKYAGLMRASFRGRAAPIYAGYGLRIEKGRV